MHRYAINNPKFVAVVFKKAPRANIAKPVEYNLFFGNISPSFPKNGKNTVSTSIYAIITHCICPIVTFKSTDIG